jgi:hypothetical protein
MRGVQILTPRDGDEVDAIRREQRNVDRTLAALDLDGYSNQRKPQIPITVLS